MVRRGDALLIFRHGRASSGPSTPFLLMCSKDVDARHEAISQAAPDSQDELHCGAPPRPTAHIGCLFSGLVGERRLSFFSRSPDSTDFIARVLP
jgi:hypothetical protein